MQHDLCDISSWLFTLMVINNCNPLNLPPHLPLNLISKFEISPVKRMHPHIPILPSTCISPSQGIRCHGVQRPEMPLHAPDLVFEDFVVEARFEFSLARGGGSYVHSGLAAAEDYEGFFGGDGGAVEGGVGGVGF